jgi:anti-sigma factor RsiW
MSSNNPHINITRSNYEDFFLLYVDGELTPEECDAVEAFAAAHPDLQEELDILLTTRLDAEPVVFMDKSALMADSMKLNTFDESLLLYLDGELKGEERAAFEWELEHNQDLQAQYELLLKTKLDPAEHIVYLHKEELYRHSERSVRPMFWLRAAAVVILMGWGAFWYMDNYGNSQDQNDMAMGTTPAPAPTAPAATTVIPAPAASAPATEALPVPQALPTDAYTPEEESPAVAANPVARTITRANYKEVAGMPTDNSSLVAYNETPVTERPRVETVDPASQQIFIEPTVTETNAGPYISVGNGTADVQPEATAKADNDKKGSMRGFLRKTARFIERRTGIDPTNEGDELMIGALTINLK